MWEEDLELINETLRRQGQRLLVRRARATLAPEQLEEFFQAFEDARTAGRDVYEVLQEKYRELAGENAAQSEMERRLN